MCRENAKLPVLPKPDMLDRAKELMLPIPAVPFMELDHTSIVTHS